MWFEIIIGIALFIFAVTAFFLIRTLITLEKTLRKLDILSSESVSLVRNTDRMLDAIQPVFNSINNIGEIADDKTSQLRAHYYMEKEKERIPLREKKRLTSEEIVEWAILSAQLVQKFANRR